MSIFNELLPKINDISRTSAKHFDDKLKETFDVLERFVEDVQNGRVTGREKPLKDKNLMTTLQSINEDDDESNKTPESRRTTDTDNARSSMENSDGRRRASKKRSKDEVDSISSPEADKRQKRKCHVKAQSTITKQGRQILKSLNENEDVVFVSSTKLINTNLIQKLRRDDSGDKPRGRRQKEDAKKSSVAVPTTTIHIKQEKISLPPETMDTEDLPLAVDVKHEAGRDEIAMPPPTAPVPKSRKAAQKEKSEDSEEESSGSGRRRTNRSRKQTESVPPPVVSTRSTRASSRASSRANKPDAEEPPLETRPKRTRNKKAANVVQNSSQLNCSQLNNSRLNASQDFIQCDGCSPPRFFKGQRGLSIHIARSHKAQQPSVTPSIDSEKENLQPPPENGIGSPNEKPRPKRTRRGQKAAEKEIEKPTETEPQSTIISPKEERISHPEPTSPLLQKDFKQPKNNNKNLQKQPEEQNPEKTKANKVVAEKDSELVERTTVLLEETKVLDEKMNVTVTLNNYMDQTMVLPNGVYNHAPVTPKTIVSTTTCNVNETVVLEACGRETIVLDKPHHAIMDATVVLEKDPKATPHDNSSLLTDDNSDVDGRTPPKQIPKAQPTSAVKEKVQQFEEMAARTTRTKTRAMAKMEESDNHTPPDKMIKPVLSEETLIKMNNMIFNGKQPQVSSSASKPRVPSSKPALPASTSKLSALGRHRDAAEDAGEDARRKKEALLEAKRELQKKKREDKMAAAAAAREAAERERRLALEAAARERTERQAHADLGRMERLKEVERKKLELARKVAETEERRKAEEQARQQRLAEEQKRADAARRKQLEEADAMKKEAAIMAKEIEKRQKEYIEKQKMKHRFENDRMHAKTPGTPSHAMEPVYMTDGFQYLNSDEDEEQVHRPAPAWSTSKARRLALVSQSEVSPAHIDALFSVRVHSPDLREIFPAIERGRLKRTSSAVWRTPPAHKPLPPLRE